MTDTLKFHKEDVPGIERTVRSGSPWEELLSPLRDTPGVSYRLSMAFDEKKTALSRLTTIRARLNNTVPMEKWDLNVRMKKDGKNYIWATFVKDYTEDEHREVLRRRAERGNSIRAGREKAKQPTE